MNIGKVIISDDFLLRYLDYCGGTIVKIYKSEIVGKVEVVIVHPDMPLTREGQTPIVVNPKYVEYCDSIGRKVVWREKPDA